MFGGDAHMFGYCKAVPDDSFCFCVSSVRAHAGISYKPKCDFKASSKQSVTPLQIQRFLAAI